MFDVACKALLVAEQQHRSALLDRRLQQIHKSPPNLMSVRCEIMRPNASGFMAALSLNFSSAEEPLMLCLGKNGCKSRYFLGLLYVSNNDITQIQAGRHDNK